MDSRMISCSNNSAIDSRKISDSNNSPIDSRMISNFNNSPMDWRKIIPTIAQGVLEWAPIPSVFTDYWKTIQGKQYEREQCASAYVWLRPLQRSSPPPPVWSQFSCGTEDRTCGFKYVHIKKDLSWFNHHYLSISCPVPTQPLAPASSTCCRFSSNEIGISDMVTDSLCGHKA